MRRLIFGIIIFAGCSKKEDPPISIQVLESVTNSPVGGAYLNLYNCVRYCSTAGSGRGVFMGTTDANGICLVPSQYYDLANSMNAQHSDYWPFEDFMVVRKTVYLTPFGSLQLRIRRARNYSGNSLLEVALKGQNGRYGDVRTFVTSDARDTTVTLFAFGAQQNKIEWNVKAAYPDYTPIANGILEALPVVPRLDTLKNVTLSY
jgi:hypothetical protein